MSPLIVSLLFAVAIAQTGAMVIDEKTPVGLGILIGCTSSIVVVVWVASARVQKVLNRLNNGDERMTRIEKKVDRVEKRIERVEVRQ